MSRRKPREITRRGTRMATARDPDRPWKVEILDGKLYFEGTTPGRVLGWLLEYLGTDKAVAYGPPEVWLESLLARLDAEGLERVSAATQRARQSLKTGF
jgi:hypothetical protein